MAVSFDWRDVYAEEHAAAFTVAKMARIDLLQTVQEHVTRAIQEGRSLKAFAADLRPILEKEGWWGRKTMADPATGAVREAQLGSPRRLEIIYDTNLRSAYSAGRWERFQRSKAVLPLLTYRTMRDSHVRWQHKAWDGVTLPQDDAWWNTHYPPNGWRCRCIAYAIDQAGAQELADAGRPIRYDAPPTTYKDWTNPRTGEVRKLPEGIDPGFDYNPGKARQAKLEQLLKDKETAFAQLQQPERLPSLAKLERFIQQAEVETGYIVDAKGAVIRELKGDADSIDIDAETGAAMTGRVVTHNHTEVGAFSPGDIAVACRWQALEMRAVDALYLYSMRPPASGWDRAFWEDTVKPVYESVQAEVVGKLMSRLQRGEIGEAAFWEELYHRIWTDVATQTGMSYERLPAP
ncbi:phage minor head protein [Methylogaea oryzae]|uniref:phage head morphogenesis protein n=1 Tax=Methylogaea oryzae TaxID=1295382 RepID=UPI001C7FFAA0|nr:phage minor head protein [Methylogaea oryzae]